MPSLTEVYSSSPAVATPSLGTLMEKAAGAKNLDPATRSMVAREFESMFLSQMLASMFSESEENPLFDDNESSEVFKGMMIEQYATQIARSGGIGIASYVEKELLRLQELNQPAPLAPNTITEGNYEPAT